MEQSFRIAVGLTNGVAFGAGRADIGPVNERTAMPETDFDFFLEEDAAALGAAELTKKTLIDTQERMGMMLDLMPMGLLIHTMQGIIFANQEACWLLQISQSQAIGHHFLDFVEAEEIPPVSRQFEDSFANDKAMHNRETRIVHADGSEVHIKLISSRLPWQGTPVIQVLLQDVTDLKRTEQKLRRLSITDELTGAFNRRHAFYEAALYVDPQRRPQVPLSAILLDIDHFKKINDVYGHAIGDHALVSLTRAANEIVTSGVAGDSAMFARIGGEEFLLLLPGVGLSAAVTVAEKLRRAIETIRIDAPAGSFGFTASLGVASYRDEDGTFDGLLLRCDNALYDAKSSGRNRVGFG